jgi:hypothetical protein
MLNAGVYGNYLAPIKPPSDQKLTKHTSLMSWDSSVSTVTGYEVNDRGLIPGKDMELSLSPHPDRL